MVNEKIFYLTEEGLVKFKAEYRHLKKIKSLKTRGEFPKAWHSEDLNPEYLSFQEDLNLLETRLAEVTVILKNAELIKIPPKEKRNTVNLGAAVLVELNGQIEEFSIVGSLEADATNNKISNESPVGQALIGKRAGETVKIITPIVNHSCKILKIKYKNLQRKIIH